MIGGVLNNFILAFIIYTGIALYWGERTIPFQNAYEGMDFVTEAQALGFRNGDVLLTADGKTIDAANRTAVLDMFEANEVKVLRNHKDTVSIHLPSNALITLPQDRQPLAFRLPVFVKQVVPGEPAAKAGVLEGDRIIAVGDSLTPSYTELVPALQAYGGKPVTIKVLRGNKTLSLQATPTEGGKLGFGLQAPDEVFEWQTTRYGFFEAIPIGISTGTGMLTTYVGSLRHLFSKEGASQIGGFGAIGSLFPPKWDWRTFWEMTAFLSIILGFMNIIPIPALDGGHVMFLLWEMVTRRKPSDKFLEYAQMAGMFFLLALLIYANSNDIYRFLIK